MDRVDSGLRLVAKIEVAYTDKRAKDRVIKHNTYKSNGPFNR
jgi:hypothetical protein